ncbi:MAG: DUF4340 domain-containing protein [Candidatus Aminicenantes bacterium]|nr:DUF4340 domain-containing protein [Candidatus Aminicenantes bacterium]
MTLKKIKTEYIVLAVVIIVLSFYLVLRQSDKVHYKIPELKPLVKEDLTKIEIDKAGKKVVLTGKDKKWTIGDKNYPTDANQVDNILDTIAQLTLSDMASQSRNYKLYELDDEKKITVKAFQADKIVREFEIGKQAPTFEHTFVKIAGDDRVFYARRSVRGYFDHTVDELRDKWVMKFDRNEISEIRVFSAGKESLFIKKATGEKPKSAAVSQEDKTKTPPPLSGQPEQFQWLTKDGKEGDKSKLESFIDQLADLRCEGFMEDRTPADFKDKTPIFILTVKGSKSYSLSVFEKPAAAAEDNKTAGDEDKTKYPAVSSENPFPFWLAGYKGDNFIRDAGELLKEEKKPELEAKPGKKKEKITPPHTGEKGRNKSR